MRGTVGIQIRFPKHLYLHRSFYQTRQKTYDEKEKSFFNKLDKEWWNSSEKNNCLDFFNKIIGKGAYSLHDYNKRRFDFICKNYGSILLTTLKTKEESIKRVKKTFRILDVGCGGGILCEYIKKNMFYFLVQNNLFQNYKNQEKQEIDVHIEGIDISEKLIELAKKRKKEKENIICMKNQQVVNHILKENEKQLNTSVHEDIGLIKQDNITVHINLNYKHCDVSELVYLEEINNKSENKEDHINISEGSKKYDIIICSEVIEHVSNEKKDYFIKCLSHLSKEDGLVVFTTLHKNIMSYMYSILLAEYISGMIKKGTHHYDKFIDEPELKKICQKHNLIHQNTEHVVYVPLIRKYFSSNKLKLLYLSSFVNKNRIHNMIVENTNS